MEQTEKEGFETENEEYGISTAVLRKTKPQARRCNRIPNSAWATDRAIRKCHGFFPVFILGWTIGAIGV